LELNGSVGLGVANIADYPITVALTGPGSAAPGSIVTIMTSTDSNAGTYTLATTARLFPHWSWTLFLVRP
jgi:hypothetical protein